jgi:hypothetical protein
VLFHLELFIPFGIYCDLFKEDGFLGRYGVTGVTATSRSASSQQLGLHCCVVLLLYCLLCFTLQGNDMFFFLSKVCNGIISLKADHGSVHTFILVKYLNAFFCLFEDTLLTWNVM